MRISDWSSDVCSSDLGPAVAMSALEAAFAMVAETGIAYVGCRNSNHLGALAPYGLKACERGYVMIAGTNASTTIAPWGGRDARLGNNPLSIAAPCPKPPHFLPAQIGRASWRESGCH